MQLHHKNIVLIHKGHKSEKIFALSFPKTTEHKDETFVCKRCNKETSVNDGSTFHQIYGVCMEATKDPELKQEDKDWLVLRAQEKKRREKKMCAFCRIYPRIMVTLSRKYLDKIFYSPQGEQQNQKQKAENVLHHSVFMDKDDLHIVFDLGN